ncbi:hypothetical protein AGMMS50267_12250 [Spirochaetia bacterium]|nr:hypothetical protein AGMMS50267_12250 [Spirochaetia bacterium]
MKTIAINSIKGGTGKTTLSVLFINALMRAGNKCLVIDADASNNSLSFFGERHTLNQKSFSCIWWDVFFHFHFLTKE